MSEAEPAPKEDEGALVVTDNGSDALDVKEEPAAVEGGVAEQAITPTTETPEAPEPPDPSTTVDEPSKGKKGKKGKKDKEPAAKAAKAAKIPKVKPVSSKVGRTNSSQLVVGQLSVNVALKYHGSAAMMLPLGTDEEMEMILGISVYLATMTPIKVDKA